MASLLEDPRASALAGLLDPRVSWRNEITPVVEVGGDDTGRGSFTVGMPQTLVDLLKSFMLPGAVKQGYQPTHKDLSEFALNVMGGGLLTGSAPAGSLGANVIRRSTQLEDEIKRGAAQSGISEDAFSGLARSGYIEPQVAPIGVRGQELGFPTPYSKGLKVPIDRLRQLDAGLLTSTPKTAGPRSRRVNIEDLEGKVLVPMPGDRTSRQVISRIAGQKIDPYQVQGGYHYMPDVRGWASGEGVISRYKSLFDDLGDRAVGVGTPMAGTGSDYAHAGVDLLYKTHDIYGMPAKTKKTILERLNVGIKKANEDAIEEAKDKAKESGKKFVPPKKIQTVKAFDGKEKELFDRSPMHRKLFMETLDLAKISRLEGAPDAVTLRHAITDDRFRHLKRSQSDPLSGFDFMGFPQPKVIPTSQTKLPHKSYSHHIGGDYLGGLEVPIPRSILFPDFAAKMVEDAKPLHRHNYMFDRLKPMQEVTEKLIEQVRNFERGLLTP